MGESKWPVKWAGKKWMVTEPSGLVQELTEEKLDAFYRAVPEGPAAMCRALKVSLLSSRTADRALQLLRREKLIRYVNRTWVQT